MEASILVATDIIRERRSEESHCRNLFPDEAFLLSNAVALEKKIKVYVVRSIKYRERRKKLK